MSRNSLREALATLVSEGVLVSRRGGGAFVRWQHDGWSEQNIVQPLKTLMENDPDYSFDILEARPRHRNQYRLQRAAMRATEADKEKLIACFEATQSSDRMASPLTGRPFLAIYPASHNVVLLQTMRGFFDLPISVKRPPADVSGSAGVCPADRTTRGGAQRHSGR